MVLPATSRTTRGGERPREPTLRRLPSRPAAYRARPEGDCPDPMVAGKADEDPHRGQRREARVAHRRVADRAGSDEVFGRRDRARGSPDGEPSGASGRRVATQPDDCRWRQPLPHPYSLPPEEGEGADSRLAAALD